MIPGVFTIDKQTLNDLAIFHNGQNGNSVFNLFNRTITIGGREKLEEIFNNPLTDSHQIKERIAAIGYFQKFNTEFGIDKPTCDFIEFYLKQRSKPKAFFKAIALLEKAIYSFNSNNDYYVIEQGVINALKMVNVLDKFTWENDPDQLPDMLKDFHLYICRILSDNDFSFIKEISKRERLSAFDIAGADHVFREKGLERLKTLLDIVYTLDVFRSVAATGKALGFSLPVIVLNNEHKLTVKGLYHPFLSDPVANNIEFNYDQNLCFVTGTNMAGKSTFLKAIGISIYLSQLGFPVPAAYMETSTFKGLITTINLSDDIFHGHSHFYNEVLRVKYVANKLKETPDIFVIFDELFRGTNVKDAFDASLAIISAFSRLRRSFFVISTHIVEVANELGAIKNINFKYMETNFDNGVPKYSYKLHAGITEERLGMWMVKNEGIVEIIEGIAEREDY